MSEAGEAQPDRPDVFVSYSRRDSAFVRELVDALAGRGKDAWVDLEDIPPTAEWMAEIERGIDVSGAFSYVISPDALASPTCAAELTRALQSGKRILPLLRREPDGADVPSAIASRNWILARDTDAFAAAVDALADALDTDLDWVRAHTRLLVRAREWEKGGRDAGMLLRGAELQYAEEALRVSAGREPPATQLQTEYVLTSRQAVTRRKRILIGSAVLVLLAALALGGFGVWQWRSAAVNEQTARSRTLAGSAVSQLLVDPESSLLLALEAERIHQTDEADSALRRALVSSHVRKTVRTGAALGDYVFSGDGRRALAIARSIALWDLDRDRRLASFPGRTAAFSADGSRAVVIGNGNGIVRVIDRNGGPVALLRGAGDDAVLSADGSRLATKKNDHVIRIHVLSSGRTRILRGDSTALGTTGLAAVLSRKRQRIRVVDVDTGRSTAVDLGETVADSMSFTPDGSAIETEDPIGNVALWDPRTGAQLYGEKYDRGAPPGYRIATLAPDGRLVVTAMRNFATESGGGATLESVSHDAHVSAPSGRLVATLHGHAGYLESAAFSSDGRRIVTAANDSTARVWDARSGESLLLLRDSSQLVTAAFAAGGRVVTADGMGTVRVWDTGATVPQRAVPGRTGAVSPSGRFAASLDGNRVRLFDVAGGGVTGVGTTAGRDAELAVGDDGRVSVKLDDRVRVIGSRRRPDEAAAAAALVRERSGRAAASADGHLVATAAGENALLLDSAPAKVWDGTTGQLRFALKTTVPILSVAVSRDGTRVVTGGADGSVILWDAGDGRQIRVLTAHADRVLDVAFSPDGKEVASASRDTFARVVPVDGGAAIVLAGHGDAVETVAFSDDGALVLTTGGDHTARLWEAATGVLLETFPVRDEAAAGLGRGAAVFGPKSTIVTASSRPAVRVYACDVCRPVAGLVKLAHERVTRPLSREERIRYLGEQP